MRLTEEQRMLRDIAREFARTRLAPYAAERDREARFPAEALAELGKLGFMGMLVPEAYGGAGADHVGYALVHGGDRRRRGGGLDDLERAELGRLHAGAAVRLGRAEAALPEADGEGRDARLLLPDRAAGGLRRGGDQDAGAAPRQPLGVERHQAVHQLRRSTRRSRSSLRSPIPSAARRGISAFLVPTDSPGFRVAGLEHKLGQRASDTAQLVFEEVELTPDLMLGAEGEGYRIALSNLEGGRIGVGAQSVGMARAAYEAALAYAREREAFGAKIIEHQAVAFRLADMATQIAAARGLVLDAAARRDAGEPCLKEAAMAKLFASEMAERVASDAIQIHGGYGYVADFPVERI